MKRNVTNSLELMLWSILTSSSRQLVGTEGEAEKNVAPGGPPVGVGIRARSARPLGSTGTWFPGNGKPVLGSIGQSVLEPVVGLGHRSLKFPCRSARDGT